MFPPAVMIGRRKTIKTVYFQTDIEIPGGSKEKTGQTVIEDCS